MCSTVSLYALVQPYNSRVLYPLGNWPRLRSWLFLDYLVGAAISVAGTSSPSALTVLRLRRGISSPPSAIRNSKASMKNHALPASAIAHRVPTMDAQKPPSPRQLATPAIVAVQPFLLKPQRMNGLSERLLVSHYENNY